MPTIVVTGTAGETKPISAQPLTARWAIFIGKSSDVSGTNANTGPVYIGPDSRPNRQNYRLQPWESLYLRPMPDGRYDLSQWYVYFSETAQHGVVVLYG